MAYGNALLPLAVDVPDIAGAYFRGQQMYGAQQEQQAQNALRAAMQQYGPAAMRGDQNALAQLAQFDPKLGLSMMGSQQDMEMQRRQDARAEQQNASGLRLDEARLGQIRESQRLAVSEHAMRMDAATREREAADAQREAAMLTLAYQKGPEEWARVAPGLLGGQAVSFEDAPYLIAGAQGSVEGLVAPEMKPTDDMREFMESERNPAFAAYMDKRRPQTSVNVNSASETEYDKARGKQFAERANAISTEAQAAGQALSALDVMAGELADPNFYSGFGADKVMMLKRAAAAIGADPEGVSSMETFNSMAKKAALDSMGGSLGTGFSNADRDFVMDQVPNLGNTPEGNTRLIDVQKKIQQRRLDVAKRARQYEADHGRLDLGFEDELAAWAAENPLFSDAPGGGDESIDSILERYR